MRLQQRDRDEVVTGAAVDDVGAAVAIEVVGPTRSGEPIVTQTAAQIVAGVVAAQHVVTAAGRRVLHARAQDVVLAGLAGRSCHEVDVHRRGPVAVVRDVVARAAQQQVIAWSAVERVVARAAVEHVVAAAAAQGGGSEVALGHVAADLQHVVAGPSIDDGCFEAPPHEDVVVLVAGGQREEHRGAACWAADGRGVAGSARASGARRGARGVGEHERAVLVHGDLDIVALARPRDVGDVRRLVSRALVALDVLPRQGRRPGLRGRRGQEDSAGHDRESEQAHGRCDARRPPMLRPSRVACAPWPTNRPASSI